MSHLMRNLKVINVLPSNELSATKLDLESNGFRVLEADTTGLNTVDLVYRKLVEILPSGHLLSGNRHWDAFLDTISDGIFELSETQVAIAWSGANDLLEESLSDFLDVVLVFLHLQERLRFMDRSFVCVLFIVGEGANFRKLSY